MAALTWAIPVTVILTPWEVYTAGEVTVNVIVFSDNLQYIPEWRTK